MGSIGSGFFSSGFGTTDVIGAAESKPFFSSGLAEATAAAKTTGVDETADPAESTNFGAISLISSI